MSGIDATKERIATVITEPLADLGYDLEAVELTPAGNRRVLRIAVDRDGGITLDDVADATRAINELLDADGVMGEQPYTLEVTSRGVDRPLTLARHWRRNVDRLVKVTPVEGAVFTGRIISSTEESVTFDVNGRQRTVAIAAIAKGLVQVEFNRRPSTPPGPRDVETVDEAELDAEGEGDDERDDFDEFDDLDDADEADGADLEDQDDSALNDPNENEKKED